LKLIRYSATNSCSFSVSLLDVLVAKNTSSHTG
jgi:hypothetical protein